MKQLSVNYTKIQVVGNPLKQSMCILCQFCMISSDRRINQLSNKIQLFSQLDPYLIIIPLQQVSHQILYKVTMSQHSENKLQVFQDNDFGDKVSFTVGASYGVGFLLGLTRGIRLGIPKTFKMPKKLIMNNFFNTVGKETSRYGNGFAAAGIMYYVIAGTMNLLFEDELDGVEPLHKNIICGTLTGMLYKSTLGVLPCIVGGLLGATMIGGLTLLTEQGNRRGIIAFEMKF